MYKTMSTYLGKYLYKVIDKKKLNVNKEKAII